MRPSAPCPKPAATARRSRPPRGGASRRGARSTSRRDGSPAGAARAASFRPPGDRGRRALGREPGPLARRQHRPGARFEHPTAPDVQHDQASPAQIEGVTPLVLHGPPAFGVVRLVGLPVDPLAELAQHIGGVLGGDHLGEERVLGDLVRGEIAQVLIDPVGGEPAADPLGPPVPPAHLRPPAGRDVPVVDYLVVVEDHHTGHGGEQPADLPVAPRLQVELAVLFEAGHLVGRGVPGPPPAPLEQPLHRREVTSA